MGLPWIQSQGRTDDDVWKDYTIDELLANVGMDHGVLSSHVLAYGWSQLIDLVPFAEKQRIIETIRAFRSQGWFTISFVRHPGEHLTSFYYYVLDAHKRGWVKSEAHHADVVDRTLEEFVSQHWKKELLPDYWQEFDHIAVAGDESFRTFFARCFGHQYRPGVADPHASGSLGYAHYCTTGGLSVATQARIEGSRNMEIYREILAASGTGDESVEARSRKREGQWTLRSPSRVFRALSAEGPSGNRSRKSSYALMSLLPMSSARAKGAILTLASSAKRLSG